MSSDPSTPPAQATTKKRALNRRQFLQVATTTAGATALGLVACREPAADAPPSTGEGATTATTAAPSGTPAPTPTPPPPNVIPVTTDVRETWIEPWVWRPADWPGQQLHLNFVENENPGPTLSATNPSSFLFSWGGITPGPTIRLRGDEVLRIKLRNLMPLDAGKTSVGPFPDVNELTNGQSKDPTTWQNQPATYDDWCLGEHTNGQHAAHTTNLHTHGLHVRPGLNPDGTQSDNIILRVMPHADYRARQASPDPDCQFLRDNEQVGESNHEFRLGNVMGDPNQPHPPGTHWYHPHSHGATHNQVASGMAGFLIVEGDVDDAVNAALAGTTTIAPETKTGDHDYRERLVFMQRVLNTAKDPDSPEIVSQQQKNVPVALTNGSAEPLTVTMRPGAVERWRVLNGSVDGRGYKRFMVLEGQIVQDGKNYLRAVNADGTTSAPLTLAQIEARKQRLVQLSMDGVTLVTPDGRYEARDLAEQNGGSTSPLADADPLDPKSLLQALEACYADERSLFDCYVRPNELYLAPANRADVFFQPATAGVYTVLGKAVIVHADNPQQTLQKGVAGNDPSKAAPPESIIVAYVVVAGEARPSLDVLQVVNAALAGVPVPPYLQPIADSELAVTDDREIGARTVPFAQVREQATAPGTITVRRGQYRTRTVCYSGWGAQDFPLITTENTPGFAEFIDKHPELADLVYTAENGVGVLLPNAIRTMAVNGQFDRAFGDSSPRKFDPTDPARAMMWVNSAEEWALYNGSLALWGDTSSGNQPTGQYNSHYVSYAIPKAEGQRRFWGDSFSNLAPNPKFQIVTKGVDHPFHIHINPFWVLRIEVPDANGELHNILPAPRWQDVVWIPRNGGRVIFRSRFADYTGMYVNHCHILLHEDNGMMHVVETTPDAGEVNYIPHDRVASPGDSTRQIDELYPVAEPNTPAERMRVFYAQSIGFVDPNAVTGQVYPGFAVEPPDLA